MNCLSRIFVSLATVLLACFSLPPSLTAQGLRNSISVVVPFGFENGSQHLAPGRYSLQLITDNILLVRGKTDGTNFMIQPDQSSNPADTGKLIFYKYGDHYFLREVWVAGSSTHVLCRKSAAERQQEQLRVAQNRTTAAPQQVAVLEPAR